MEFPKIFVMPDYSRRKQMTRAEGANVAERTNDDVSIDDIRTALERSGYLMESRLVKMLTDARYFVEPNVAHKDPRTGKAREIDMTAEHEPGLFLRDVCAKTTFVIEAINNRFPMVLLTERSFTPNVNTDAYVKFGVHSIPNSLLSAVHPFELRERDWEELFSQFCVMTKKSGKDELMASHPDDVYASLLKLAEYTELQVEEFNSWGEEDSFRRLFTWHPMLVVSGRLLTTKVASDGDITIVDAPVARLEFNWHDTIDPKTTIVEIVREDFLLERMNALVALDARIERQLQAMIDAPDSGLGRNPP